ncbi:hypothetical protein [Streptomyces sulphureus]|nr:hypothetical protein [Streptomyces sulphureus]
MRIAGALVLVTATAGCTPTVDGREPASSGGTTAADGPSEDLG